jgi:hypothetical protein
MRFSKQKHLSGMFIVRFLHGKNFTLRRVYFDRSRDLAILRRVAGSSMEFGIRAYRFVNDCFVSGTGDEENAI